MMWKNEISLELKTYSKYHIDMWVLEVNPAGSKWRFTGFYWDPKKEPSGRNHGAYSVSSAMRLIFCGYAREILMKFSSIMSSLVALIGRSGKWRALGR
jgi:hypothetical protein